MPFTRRGLKSVARKMSKIESIGFAFKRQTTNAGYMGVPGGGEAGGGSPPSLVRNIN